LDSSSKIYQLAGQDMTMIRKLILGAASILALGIGGAALDFAADADDAPNPVGNISAASVTSHHWLNAANLSKDDIRWAQVELHTMGLYNGSLDGVVGPETKQALLGFQESNGLERTVRLDQQTVDALIGNTGVGGEGSSMPPKGAGTGSASSFGSRTAKNSTGPK
jgi:peptidoglycan hydrolase-like protein with peptidoglycan-binding domain